MEKQHSPQSALRAGPVPWPSPVLRTQVRANKEEAVQNKQSTKPIHEESPIQSDRLPQTQSQDASCEGAEKQESSEAPTAPAYCQDNENIARSHIQNLG